MIGILGGTFDPIHFGHLRPAVEIVEKLSLSELRFIPSAKPPHRRQPAASAEHRLQMVQKAIKAYPKFVLDAREYDRLMSDNVSSFTIDTVRSIRSELNNSKTIALIIGTDAFLTFTQWKDWEEILNNAHLIVVTRPAYAEQTETQAWVKQRLTTNVEQLHNSAAGKVYLCDVTQLDISATQIRKNIEQRLSCCYLTPNKVLKYINKHRLYNKQS